MGGSSGGSSSLGRARRALLAAAVAASALLCVPAPPRAQVAPRAAPVTGNLGRALRLPSQAPRRAPRRSLAHDTPYVAFEDVLLSEPLDDLHTRQLGAVVDALLNDGMGLIPTDTQHAFVTSVSSRRGARRIYDAKGISADQRKPLSLLCSDLSMAARFAEMESLPRKWYQLMRRVLPGPYTFILQASKQVPRVVLEHKSRRRLWERREVGIRIPECAVVQHLTAELGEPLLASSACEGPGAAWSAQKGSVDFVVTATDMRGIWDNVADEDRISTVIDLTMEEPVLRRQGMGDAAMFFQ